MSVSYGGSSITFEDGSVNSSGFIGHRNRIINGAMVIDQRNAGASVTPVNGQFITDRFEYVSTQTSKFTSQQSSTAPSGFINSLLFTSSSAYSVLSGDFFLVRQKIEGLNVADLGWGTASAATVTLSFWVRSSLTGTFGGSLFNSAGDRSYPFTFTVSTANTFEYKTITIVGDTSGTWLVTNGIGIQVGFGLGVGSTYSGTASSWAGAFYLSATGATSVVGTNGATFYITGVQLERGSTASSFEYRSFGTELALCQRYCYAQNKLVTNNYYAFGTAFATGSTTGQLGTPFPVSLRSNPSATYSAANLFFVDSVVSSSAGFTAIVADQVGNNYGYSSFTGGAGSTSGYSGRWLANNASAAWVIWSAEL
jgi:hypothetical protein